MKSRWNIEWDFDYGFVLTTTDGGSTYTSHPSKQGYTTSKTGVPAGNPNQSGCLDTYNNGITGSSGSYDAGTESVDRLAGNVPDPVFLTDTYDLSDLAGSEQGALRFSYATDPGLALPGWFIDDVVVTATVNGVKKVLYSSDFEDDGGPTDSAIYNGGCQEDLTVASRCTQGWKYLQAGADSPQDHAYYLEMRDRSGFDFDGKGEIDRDPIGFEAGLSLVYTDEAHGYGNAGTDDPPAQSPLDAKPTPGSSTPDLNDAAFTAAAGRSTFSDKSTSPHVDNYLDPKSKSGDWTFDYDCLDFAVTSMSGNDAAAASNLTGDVTFDLGAGCGAFDYGYVPESGGPSGPPTAVNKAPVAKATATPTTATTGQQVRFSGLESTDDTTAAGDLDYSWDFDDGGTTKDAAGPTVSNAFTTTGDHIVKLTVTDPQGLQDKTTVTVTVTGGGGTGRRRHRRRRHRRRRHRRRRQHPGDQHRARRQGDGRPVDDHAGDLHQADGARFHRRRDSRRAHLRLGLRRRRYHQGRDRPRRHHLLRHPGDVPGDGHRHRRRRPERHGHRDDHRHPPGLSGRHDRPERRRVDRPPQGAGRSERRPRRRRQQ